MLEKILVIYWPSKKKSEIIIETDDDNCPKKNFFFPKKLEHNPYTIKNNSWINIYDLFLKNKKKKIIWPRGIPLDEIWSNRIFIKKKKRKRKIFFTTRCL